MSDPLHARLDETDVARLERQLAIDMSSIEPGTYLSGETESVRAPAREEMEKAAADLVARYREGVRIAPQVESTPLVPMLAAAGTDVPPKLAAQIELGYAFYLVEATFRIMLPKDQKPRSARFALHLDDDVTARERHVRPVSLFPRREDVELFSADLEGAFGIDATATISIPKAATGVALPFGDLSADAKVRAGIVVGPFRFRFCKAKIEVAGESDQQIEWRYNLESALFGTNDFKSVLVLKVAEEAKAVTMAASLGVVPFKRSWAIFSKRLRELSDGTPPDEPLIIELSG
jgi:hypothetical protein